MLSPLTKATVSFASFFPQPFIIIIIFFIKSGPLELAKITA